jgi:tetratricopeptide (TPR) repeat protein
MYIRHSIIALAAIALVSCSRDPNYLKQKYLDSGNKYFEQKRYKEASIMYRKSELTDRKFGPAYYRLALVYLELQQVANAYPQLRRAVELLPPGSADADDATLKMSEIMLMAAQSAPNPQQQQQLISEVEPLVDGLLKRSPTSWQGHKLKADMALLATTAAIKANDAALAKQNLTTAIQEYRTALSKKPGDYLITLALARTLVTDGESAEAETLFKTLIDKDKSNLNSYFELYRIYVRDKRLPEAEAMLKSAIAAAPKDALPRMTLAQFYYGTHRQDDLVALLNDMKKDLKLFPQAYLQAGAFFARVGQFDSALKQYEEGIQKDPAQKNTYLKSEIEVYVRQNNLVMAQSKNEQILHDDPKDPEARGLRATFMLDHNQVNEAEAELQSVVTARPGNWVARFNLGRAYFAKGEYEQARQQFDKCIDLNANYLPARYAQTQVAIVRGNFDEALHDSDEILKIAPNSVQGKVMKAASLQRLNRYDDARKLLNDVLDKNPQQVESLLEIGVLDLTQRKTKDALDHFRRAYEAAPNNIRGLLGESKALLMDGQTDKSVDLIRQAAVKAPSFQMQRELGNAQMAARQFDAAISTYQALINGTTDLKLKGDLWSRIGEAYRYKGDFPKSIEFMELAAKALPDNAAIATNLALLYEAGNNLPKARTYYERALKIDQNNPLALNNLAYLITETNGDLNQAMTYATEAKQRLPNFLEVDDTIGWIYLKKNIADSAVDQFKRLVAEAPLNPTYHYHYCMALKQKGNTIEAKAECQVALASRPQKPLEMQIRTLEDSIR